MPPAIYYEERIGKLQQQLQQLQKKKSLLGWLRFAAVAGIVLAVYFLFSVGLVYFIATILFLVIVFARLIFIDLENKSAIKNTAHLKKINEDEQKALAHNYYHFEDGSRFSLPEYPYCNDLDIFGRASLFQYCNRTTSEMGAGMLSLWLLQPATTPVILQRQEAVKELSTTTEWRQQLQAYGK